TRRRQTARPGPPATRYPGPLENGEQRAGLPRDPWLSRGRSRDGHPCRARQGERSRRRNEGLDDLRRLGFGSVAFLLAVTASGCMMVGPDYHRPPAPTADSWLARDVNGLAPSSEPIGPWWETFGDPVLTTLIVDAYRGNPSLQAAG